MSDAPKLSVGEVVESNGRIWRVGLVNECRARLDPMSTILTTNPVTGSYSQLYGSSINVSPRALMKRVDPATLNTDGQHRLGQLKEQEKQMSETQTAEAPKNSNAARIAAFKAKKAAAKSTALKERQAKTKKNAEKAGKELNKCKCGCGGETMKNFVPGHDASFKGKLLKIERGDAKKEDLLPKAVIGEYKWKKVAGGGEIPTTDYKGNPHSGYAKK